MTLKEFAHKQATLLTEKPTQQNVIQVVSTILNCKVDGQPITSSQISQILRYLEDEIGDLGIILESFDNAATLSLMGEVRKLIAQAQKTIKEYFYEYHFTYHLDLFFYYIGSQPLYVYKIN